jgi:hypothetical protein
MKEIYKIFKLAKNGMPEEFLSAKLWNNFDDLEQAEAQIISILAEYSTMYDEFVILKVYSK